MCKNLHSVARLMAVAMFVAWAGQAHAQFGKLKGLVNKAKNVFGNVVCRWAECAVVTETDMGKTLFIQSVANDKVGSGWSALRFYGTAGFKGYIK